MKRLACQDRGIFKCFSPNCGRKFVESRHRRFNSFYPTKVLGGYGDGGMVVTDDRDLYDKVKRLHQYGMDGTYYAEEHGYAGNDFRNLRLTVNPVI